MPKATKKDALPFAEPSVRLFHGDGPLTVDQAKELLGWQEEEKDGNFGEIYLLKLNKTKIRCNNNQKNRPLYPSWARALAQEILRGRWKFNMQPIIIGQSGAVVSGQHRLIALVIAAELWKKAPDEYPHWDNEPSIQIVINFGCPEDDETVNTVDTGKTRSLGDVLFRSEALKDVKKPKDRKTIAKRADFAVRALWTRTKAGKPGLMRTHAESMCFLARHPRLIECVRFLYEEDGGKAGKISRYLSVGNAAALMYLMATSGSDSDAYYDSPEEERCEETLNFDRMSEAEDYFTHLGQKTKKVDAVAKVLSGLIVDGGGSAAERTVLLVKAWHLFFSGKSVTPAKIKPKYVFDKEDEVHRLAESPLIGGVDAGTEDEIAHPEPTPEEITERKAAVRSRKSKDLQPA